MAIKCYVCNSADDTWRRNLVGLKSQHSNVLVTNLLKKVLNGFQSMRNIDDESNCICIDCVSKVEDYDWVCLRAKQSEKNLYDILIQTENCFMIAQSDIDSKPILIDSVEVAASSSLNFQTENDATVGIGGIIEPEMIAVNEMFDERTTSYNDSEFDDEQMEMSIGYDEMNANDEELMAPIMNNSFNPIDVNDADSELIGVPRIHANDKHSNKRQNGPEVEFECSACSTEFNRVVFHRLRELKAHNKSVHNHTNGRQRGSVDTEYECRACRTEFNRMVFNRLPDLRAHNKSVHNQSVGGQKKPSITIYRCTAHGVEYPLINQFYAHRKKMHNHLVYQSRGSTKTIYKCVLCEIDFTRITDLYGHRKQFHNNNQNVGRPTKKIPEKKVPFKCRMVLRIAKLPDVYIKQEPADSCAISEVDNENSIVTSSVNSSPILQQQNTNATPMEDIVEPETNTTDKLNDELLTVNNDPHLNNEPECENIDQNNDDFVSSKSKVKPDCKTIKRRVNQPGQYTENEPEIDFDNVPDDQLVGDLLVEAPTPTVQTEFKTPAIDQNPILQSNFIPTNAQQPNVENMTEAIHANANAQADDEQFDEHSTDSSDPDYEGQLPESDSSCDENDKEAENDDKKPSLKRGRGRPKKNQNEIRKVRGPRRCREEQIKREKRNYECNICDEKLVGINAFKAHKRFHREQDFPKFKCKKCFYISDGQETYDAHIKLHDNVPALQCVFCEYYAPSKTRLNVHCERHIKFNSFICDICSAGFTRAISLKIHMRYHQNIKTKICPFENCNMAFVESKNLNRHLKTHTGVKPYGCRFCPRRFAVSYNIKHHERTHTERDVYRKFKCIQDGCQSGFDSRKKLNQHLEKKHSMMSHTAMANSLNETVSKTTTSSCAQND